MNAYLERLIAGPFVGRIDPWAEQGEHFAQIHGGMIGHIVTQIQPALLERGYVAGRETSLQIVNQREPDVYIHREDGLRFVPRPPYTNYADAALALKINVGTPISAQNRQRISIFRPSENHPKRELVTVIEVISPTNKQKDAEMLRYQAYRDRLLGMNVNVVEIDLTRSIKRLFPMDEEYDAPYAITVYLPSEPVYILSMAFEDVPKRFALPLRQEVLSVDTAAAYADSYRAVSIPAHIEASSKGYSPHALPFPLTLTDEQRAAAFAAVETWRAELARLRDVG